MTTPIHMATTITLTVTTTLAHTVTTTPTPMAATTTLTVTTTPTLTVTTTPMATTTTKQELKPLSSFLLQSRLSGFRKKMNTFVNPKHSITTHP